MAAVTGDHRRGKRLDLEDGKDEDGEDEDKEEGNDDHNII